MSAGETRNSFKNLIVKISREEEKKGALRRHDLLASALTIVHPVEVSWRALPEPPAAAEPLRAGSVRLGVVVLVAGERDKL